MAADPVPDDSVSLHNGQCTVIEADADRVDAALALQLLEVQTGVRRAGTKETIRPPGFLLYFEGNSENSRQNRWVVRDWMLIPANIRDYL
jgi:hypothetical protein